MRLTPQTPAPSFHAVSHLDVPVDLASLRGRPVLLSFYRYASCPVCNLRVRSLIRAYPTLSASGLEMVAVFQSPPGTIARYVGRQDAPFPIIGDAELRLYRAYAVESRWSGMLSFRVIRAALNAFRHGFAPGKIDGPVQRIPADFLIGPEGRIEIAHYGTDIDDHLPLETIEGWLRQNASADALAPQ